MEDEKLSSSGVLEEFQGSRFRIRQTEDLRLGLISTGRYFSVEELQADGTWKKLRMVKSVIIRIDAEKLTEVEITYSDGLPDERRPK